MESIIHADWRWTPCLVLALLAAWFLARAASDWLSMGRASHRNLHHMVAFRKAMLGIGFAGIGAGWWLGNPVLFWLGLVIGLEETIESSIALIGLRMEAKEGVET